MRGSVPLADAFHRKHKDDARLQVLAFHDPRVTSLEALDRRIKPLACPVLIDPTGETVREFGIDEYPTVVLIDPKGDVVSAGNEAVLPDVLEKLEKELVGKKP